MLDKLKQPMVALCGGVVLLNALLLFFLLPEVSKRLHQFYNQDVYADGYDQLAQNLASGHGYRFYPDTAETVMREPGYPIVLAGLLLLFGGSFTAVKVTNVCLALAAAGLLMSISRRLSIPPTWIALPSILFLFHPGTVIAESRGGPEMLFTFLVVLYLLLLYRAVESGRWWNFAWSGAVLGLAVLVKSTPILFPVLLLPYLLFIERRHAPTTIRHIALMIATMLFVLTPWVVRNYQLTGRFIPTASVLGVSAQAGQYMCMHRSDHKPLWLLDREAAFVRDDLAHQLGYSFRNDFYYQTFYSTNDELNFSSYLTRRVLATYKSAPLLCVKCMALNVVNFWTAGKTAASTAASFVAQLPYLVLGVAGVILCALRSRLRTIGLVLLFMTYMMAVCIPIIAQARYSVPLLPLLSALATISIVAILDKMNSATARVGVSDTFDGDVQAVDPDPVAAGGLRS